MKRSYFLIAALTFLFVLTVGTNLVTAKSLLDNFSGENLDLTKWESQYWDSQGTTVTDFVKEVYNGKLVSQLGVESGRGRNTVPFTNPGSINSIQADVTVVSITLGNDPDVSAQARIDGTFYNSQAAAGTTGDIWATTRLSEKGNGLEAEYIIEEALDENWDTYNDWRGTIATGLAYDQAHKLKIEYNEGSNEFTFTVNGLTPVTVTSAIIPSNVRATENPWRTLSTGIDNAVSGKNFIHALFDDVYVNGAVYDDFTTAPLDQAKWDALEYSRGIVDGKLHLNAQTEDARMTSSVKPKNQETNYIEAKFLIESGAQIPAGRNGLARIAGYYFNNSRDGSGGMPYDGEIGDVWVQNRISLDDSNNLTAECSLWASDKPDGWDSDAPRIWHKDFTTAIAFDTAYTLSIEYTGSAFIFKLNDETFQYDITGPQYLPSNGQYRTLQSRVYAQSGESGHIKVQVDKVYVEGDDYDGDGVSDSVDPDDDNDGISDEEETAGPNGGDSNNDGIADSLQSNVSSLNVDNSQDYIVFESPDTTEIKDCQGSVPPADAPTSVVFDYGLFEFTLDGIPTGSPITVTLSFPADAADFDTYYKFGPTPNNKTPHWYEFIYDGQTGAEIDNVNKIIVLHFIDGARGDDDLTANGTVVDIGGPAKTVATTDTGGGSGGGGGGGCFISTMKEYVCSY